MGKRASMIAAVSLLQLLTACDWLGGGSQHCTDRTVSAASSPDGKLVATVIAHVCEPPQDSALWRGVEVGKPEGHVPVLVFHSWPYDLAQPASEPTVRWMGPRELVVEYGKRLETSCVPSYLPEAETFVDVHCVERGFGLEQKTSGSPR